MNTSSPLFAYASDGIRFYKEVMLRLTRLKPAVSLNLFCAQADVAFSTTTRWKTGSKPDAVTVLRVEKAFKHFERRASTLHPPEQASCPEHADTSQA